LPQAIEAFEHAIRLKPDYATAHYNLGVARAAMGETEGALQSYAEALRYDPDHAKTHNNLGSILARKGRLKKALSHFQKALEIRPDYEEARKNSDLARQLLADPNPQILQNAAPEIRSLPGACD
jgi:tetratricopeptide (TPR) repeat protein